MSRHAKAPAENFIPGAKVQVHDRGAWRDAIIIRFASYGGGYEFQYDPLPAKIGDGYQPSTGGWTCDFFCRQRAV